MSDVIRVYFTFDDSFGDDKYRELVAACINTGCRLSQEGETELATYRTVEEVGSREASLEAALDDILLACGSITLFYKELKFNLSYYSDVIITEYGPQVSVSIWASQFKTFGKYPEREVQGRVNQFTTFIHLVAEQTDPLYVFGGKEQYETMSELLPPIDHLKAGEVNRLFWVNVFSPATVERLRRDRVLSAPAWMVEERDDGHVMLVVSNNPVHPSESWLDAGKRVGEHLNLTW